MLLAAHAVDSAAERTSLLATAVADNRSRPRLRCPRTWAAATRADARAEIARGAGARSRLPVADRADDALANRRASMADVRGRRARCCGRFASNDAALGARRPDAINALVAAVQAKLDAARQLQLARDRWALRAPVLMRYRVAIAGADRSLRAAYSRRSRTSRRCRDRRRHRSTRSITARRACSTLASAIVAAARARRGARAAHQRRSSWPATPRGFAAKRSLAGDMSRAWDASSAAAGALMLGARARADIQTLLKPPQLR